jgi:serine/threonine protein kinase/Flp pilus assembly protein TadD/TolB-like protein
MPNEFWTEVENAYFGAAGLSMEERVSFLNQTYPDRPDIHREVESLLEYQPMADTISQSTLLAAAANMFSDDDHELIGSVVAGKYLVRQCLGAGQMGEVYLADHLTLDMPFALKRPSPGLRQDPEFRRRLIDEARRAVILKHDNVARVHDIVESDNDMFVVMEYIEGETLRARIRTLSRPFSVSEFLPIAIQCASALAAAHEKRIVHLDVKPENIMLTPAGKVKVCDFGVARKLPAGTPGDTTEVKWSFAGTPAYMAPEVILSYQFDERADQFSLGTVFYEMLTGRNPFLAQTIVATTARVVKDIPPPIRQVQPDIDPRVERIVLRLLEKEPEDRYATANEIVEQFDAIRRSQERIREITADIREALKEHPWVRLVAVIVLLLAMAGPAAWLYSDRIKRWLGIDPLPEKKIVAVLPIRAIGDPARQSYSDGLTETLANTLSQVSSAQKLEVVPTSAMRANAITTPDAARKSFAANIVIDASIEAVGQGFRINIALVDPSRLKQLRATSLTISKIDSLAVQNQVTEAAIRLLEVELGSEDQARLISQTTRNPDAYRAYLEGMGHLSDRGKPESIDHAIESFRQAIAVDYNFSLAYAGLGQAYWKRYTIESKDPQPSFVDRAREACEKAVSINSKIAVGHVCLGTIDNGTGMYERAVEEFGRAIELEPNNDDAYRGLAQSHERLNNWEAAEATYLKAIEIRPSYWFSYVWLGQFYLFSRQQYAEAIAVYQKAVDRAPENPEPYAGLCGAYILSARRDEAVQACNKSIQLKPTPFSYINLGVAYWGLRSYVMAADSFDHAVRLNPRYYKAVGHLARAYSWIPQKRAEAPDLYRKAISLASEELKINPRDADIHVMVARYNAMLGDRVEALSHLQIALTLRPKDAEYKEIAAVIYNQFHEKSSALNYLERAVTDGYSISKIDTERELDNLREDPRFRALITSQSRKGDKE